MRANRLAALAVSEAERRLADALVVSVTTVSQGAGLVLEKAIMLVGHAVTLVVKGVAAIVGGVVGEALGIIFDFLFNADILLPVADNDNGATRTRSVPSHEYGDFVLCDLLERRNPQLLSFSYSEAASVLGDQTADKEHAVINEAMADYITGQIAGAVDYSHHLPTLHNGAYNLATAPADGLEFNPAFGVLGQTDTRERFNEMVGHLASLIDDFFDGAEFVGLADTPSNAHPWTARGGQVFVSTGTPEQDGVRDAISIRRGGLFRVLIARGFTVGSLGLRYPNLFRGLGRGRSRHSQLVFGLRGVPAARSRRLRRHHGSTAGGSHVQFRALFRPREWCMRARHLSPRRGVRRRRVIRCYSPPLCPSDP